MSREDNLRLEPPNNICWNTPAFTQAPCHGFTLFFVEVVVERNHEGVELKKKKVLKLVKSWVREAKTINESNYVTFNGK